MERPPWKPGGRVTMAALLLWGSRPALGRVVRRGMLVSVGLTPEDAGARVPA
jgi:hypothetical protein